MRTHNIYRYVIRNDITLEDLNNKLLQNDANIIAKTERNIYNRQKIKSIESKRKLKRSIDIFFNDILEDIEDYILETRKKIDNLNGNSNAK
jgi:predicted transglutaminase-like protease